MQARRDSLLKTNQFVHPLQKRQDLKIACSAESAHRHPVAELLRLGRAQLVGQQQGLGPGDRIDGGQGQPQPGGVERKRREGKRTKPVALPLRVRSSTRACARWRTCRCCRQPSP